MGHDKEEGSYPSLANPMPGSLSLQADLGCAATSGWMINLQKCNSFTNIVYISYASEP